jgi:hypothetical protein
MIFRVLTPQVHKHFREHNLLYLLLITALFLALFFVLENGGATSLQYVCGILPTYNTASVA